MNTTRVLLVDDNTSLCKTMSFILERKGYDVSIVIDGEAAIDRVREQLYDVIIMDIKMPKMDGVETFKKMKKVRPDIPVLMMTGYAVPDLVDEALKEGAWAVMYKPFDMEVVLKQIEEIVSSGKRLHKGRPAKK